MKFFFSTRFQTVSRDSAALASLGILGLVLFAVLLTRRGWDRHETTGRQIDRGRVTVALPHNPLPVTDAADKAQTPMVPADQVDAALRTLRAFAAEFRALEAGAGGSEQRKTMARQILARLRDALRNLPTHVAEAAIVQFLESGEDAATGLDFNLEAGGVLGDAPSVRTSLLDMLGQIDPSSSVTYARRIFDQSNVADEWALAMRNIGWQNRSGDYSGELRERLNQMLDNQAWLSQPTNGFLEAFDLAVHLGTTADLDAMASVIRIQDSNGNVVQNGTTHAAFLALDRITLTNPDLALARIAADSTFLDWAPEHRGALMSRGDVSSPRQRAALETYLQTLAKSPADLSVFTDLFPNHNLSIGPSLVSTSNPAAMDFERIFQVDQNTLAAVNEWRNDSRFSSVRSNLDQISLRLQQFIADARTPSPSEGSGAPPSSASGSGSAQQ